MTARPPRRILVLATFEGVRDPSYGASVIRDYLFSFNEYSRHTYYYVTNAALLPPDIDFDAFDAILIFWTLHLRHPSQLSEAIRDRIQKSAALKILFLQDEYRDVRAFNDVMRELGVNLMFTCVAERDHAVFYPPASLPSLRGTYTVLPGYVPPYLENVSRAPRPERDIDLSYRSREVPYWLGDLARHKTTVADRLRSLAERHGLRTDMSVREQDRIYGRRWVEFLRRSRCVLGSPSGASVIDFTGEIKRRTDEYLRTTPDAPYEAVKRACFAGVDGKVVIDTISPRAFEATALGCTLVQVEGWHSGIVAADEHYIAVNADYSNTEDVVRRIADRGYCARLAERAHADLIASGRYSYRQFVRDFDDRIDQHVPVALGRPAPSQAGFYARQWIGRGQRVVPWRGRYAFVGPWWLSHFELRQRLPDLLYLSSALWSSRLGRAIVAMCVAVGSPTLQRILGYYCLAPGLWGRVTLPRLLAELVRLEVVRRLRSGTFEGADRHQLDIADDGAGRLTLRSRSGTSGASPLKRETAAALLEGRIRELIWDHRSIGPVVACRLIPRYAIPVWLGSAGSFSFDAVMRVYERTPRRTGPCLMSILLGETAGEHAPGRSG